MKLAVVFNGQGSTYVNMGASFYDEVHASKDCLVAIERASGCPIRTWLKDESKLQQTRFAQLAVSATSLAIYQGIQNQLPSIDWMAGLSLGEYTALCAAGAISLEQIGYLLDFRGQLMSKQAHQLDSAGLAAMIGLQLKQVHELIQASPVAKEIYIANVNSDKQIVIGGYQASLKEFGKWLKEAGFRKPIPLKVEGPFHTPLMAGIQEEFEEYLQTELTLHQLHTPVIANLTALPYEEKDIQTSLVKHLTETTYWHQTIEYLVKSGMTHLIQIGPGDTLVKMLGRDENRFKTCVIQEHEDGKQLESFLK